MDSQTHKVLIAGGGTGGHIFPVICIAKQLQSHIPVEFVHGSSQLEKNIFSRQLSTHNIVCHCLSIGRLRANVSWKERITTYFMLPLAVLKSMRIILKTKTAVVFGSGGAVSGPVVLAGILLRRKTIIWEPNVIPGLTNRWLSRFVDVVLVGIDETKHYLKAKKIIQVPFPVRSELENISSTRQQNKQKNHFFHVLILGGSQGASLINKVVSEVITNYNQLSFVHQTGEKDFPILKKKYHGLNHVQVFPFLHEIHQFYEWADVVIGRAGMGMVAELSYIGRASVLIPLSHASDNHQWKNAHLMEKNKAAILIEEKNWNTSTLTQTLYTLIQNPEKINSMAKQAQAMKLSDLGHAITQHIISLISK